MYGNPKPKVGWKVHDTLSATLRREEKFHEFWATNLKTRSSFLPTLHRYYCLILCQPSQTEVAELE